MVVNHEVISKTRSNNLTVIDLGTGTGINIRDFIKNHATVYAYDADPEALKIVHDHFKPLIEQKKLFLYQQYFEHITSLPKSDVIIAWRSLPFMEKQRFLDFWKIITNSLTPNGLFVGTFFGTEHYLKRSPKSPAIFRMSRKEVLHLFDDFQILYFYDEMEYDEKSSKSWEMDQYEQIYKIIARKK